MPELPEVEIFRRYFDHTSLHREIAAVTVRDTYVLSEVTPRDLEAGLAGRHFVASDRFGKYLFGERDTAGCIVFHFGMTGSLSYFDDPADEPPFTRVRFDFTRGFLAYVDVRKLGMITLTPGIDQFRREKKLGPDACEVGFEEFRKILSGKRGAIKSALMDQSLISGIGNIYSDEILFQAGIPPQRKINILDETAIRAIYDAMKEVLGTAIHAGADMDKLPPSYLIPHREKGGMCPRCGHSLARIKVGGRTGYYCPEHQRV
ncbi:MAG: hypothetical protein LUQ17_04290 [Methanomicrobiales archaeon]|nr:hypothetical protein [Methanomicrobiales archaeon]